MSRILVTGAGGFIGSNLLRKIIKSDDVSIIVKKNSNLWRIKDIIKDVKTYNTDLSNYELTKMTVKKIMPEIIFHLASYGGYPDQDDIGTAVNTNITSTINLMSASQKLGVKFVNIGSSSEYGPKSKPMKEDDIAEPITSYGITKLAQTLFGTHFQRSKNLPVVTLRLFSVYGPYEIQGRLVSDIMIALVNRKHLQLSSPKIKRDFIFVDDVIDAMIKTSKTKNIEGEVFNIGTGVENTIKQVADMANKIGNHKISISWNSEKKRSFDIGSHWLTDTKKTNKLLKWKPKYSLHDGLTKTLEWYRDNAYLYEKISNR